MLNLSEFFGMHAGHALEFIVKAFLKTVCFTLPFYFTFDFKTDGCHIGPLIMPHIILTGEDICGTPITKDFPLPALLPSLPNNLSNCTDCFSIIKLGFTASPPPVMPFENLLFAIQICGNNSSDINVNVQDILPPSQV